MRKDRTSAGVTRAGNNGIRKNGKEWDNETKCYTLGEIRLGLTERESYAIDWCSFGGEMSPWIAMLVRQVVLLFRDFLL